MAIENGSTVALEFAPTVSGRVVKTHLPEHGDSTFDVQINYSFNPRASLERLRIRDVPSRCLIEISDPPLEENLPDDRTV